DEDRCYATGQSGDLLDLACVDAQLLKIFNHGWTEQVAAHPSHHKDVRSAQTGSHRLIRTLASEAQVKFLAKYRLSRFGELISKSSEIDVGAADYRDSGTFSHKRSSLQAGLRPARPGPRPGPTPDGDRKSTRLNSSHVAISYAVFC